MSFLNNAFNLFIGGGETNRCFTVISSPTVFGTGIHELTFSVSGLDYDQWVVSSVYLNISHPNLNGTRCYLLPPIQTFALSFYEYIVNPSAITSIDVTLADNFSPSIQSTGLPDGAITGNFSSYNPGAFDAFSDLMRSNNYSYNGTWTVGFQNDDAASGTVNNIVVCFANKNDVSFPSNIPLFIQGQYPSEETYDANSYFPLFIEGGGNPVNSNIPLFIEGYVENRSLDLFISGIGNGDRSLDLFIASRYVADSLIPLFERGAYISDLGTNLFVSGMLNSSYNFFDLSIVGGDNYVYKGLDLFISGSEAVAQTESSMVNLFIEGYGTGIINSNTYLYINGSGFKQESSLELFVRNDFQTKTLPMFINGEGMYDNAYPYNDSLDLFLRRFIGDALPLTVMNNIGVNNSMDLSITGGYNTSESLDLVIPNVTDTRTRNLPLYTHGFK